MYRLQRHVAVPLILVLAMGMTCASAQKPGRVTTEVPTIQVSTGVELILPQKWYNEIWAPFLKDSYAVTIRTKDGKKSWPGVYDRIAGFKDERTGSQTFVYRIRCTFDEQGEYVIEKVFAGTDETGKRIQKREQWNVVVRHPVLTAPLAEDSYYYFGESPVIAFATREFPEAQGYTYSVWQTNGVRVDTGSGSNIFLSKIVNDPKSAASEKEFEARGYYAGRTFDYINPKDSAVHKSIWRFRIRKPILDAIGILWDGNAKTDVDSLPVLAMDLRGAYNPRLFSYVYLGRKGNALIVTQAKINGLTVESDPPEFLSNYSPPVIGGVWTDIVISPNFAFLQSGSPNEPKLVTLRLTFDTQLERRVTRTYRALVY